MANKETKITSFRGTGGLKAAVITAEKPVRLKRRETEQQKEKEIKIREEGGIKPFPAAYNGGRPRRIDDGGRLKRRNEKQ